MTDREKQSLKIRLGRRLSTDRRGVMEIVKEEVDKTPTVETKECPYSCEKCAKKMICELGKEMERAKGEWNHKDKRFNFTDFCECSNCHKEFRYKDLFELDIEGGFPKFCPNCGADMIGGAE